MLKTPPAVVVPTFKRLEQPLLAALSLYVCYTVCQCPVLYVQARQLFLEPVMEAVFARNALLSQRCCQGPV